MQKRSKKGFTLAELLIVVAIIAVLFAIMVPVFGAELNKAKFETVVANVRSAYAEEAANAMLNGTLEIHMSKISAAAGDDSGNVSFDDTAKTITIDATQYSLSATDNAVINADKDLTFKP